MAIKFDQEIQARGWSRADMGLDHLNAAEQQYLTKSFQDDLNDGLGIHFNPDGKVIEGDTPRIFVVEKNRHDQETLSSINSSQVKLGTEEFWRQVQLGNVFVYPVGSKDPVQVQVKVTDPVLKTKKLGYSKPVTKDTMPTPPAKPLGFWKRAAWLFTGGNAFNKQRMEYKNRMASKDQVLEKLRRYANNRTKLDKERSDHEKWLRDEKVRAAQQELINQKNNAKKLGDIYENGMAAMTKLFRPDPQWDQEMDVATHTKGLGLYTKEEFNNLKRYSKTEIDLDQITVGSDKQPLTPEEFASVTFLAMWDPEIAKIGVKRQNILDKYVPQGLEQMEVPKADIPEVMTAHARSFATTDLFISDFRPSGGTFFKEYTNAGRKAAVEAFNEYSKGKPDKLAGIIAKGVNLLANEARGLENTKISAQQKGSLAVADKILGLLEKDPGLRQLAEQKGMGKEQLQTVKNLKTLKDLDQAALRAEQKLGDGALGEKLTQKQKRDLAVDIIKSRVAISKIRSELGDEGKNPEYTAKLTQLALNTKQVPQGNPAQLKKADKRPNPGPGKIWSANQVPLFTGLAIKYRNDPVSLKELGTEKGMEHLDKLARKIVEQQKLDTLPEKELFDVLRTADGNGKSLKLSEAIPVAEEALKNPQRQQGGPQLQNQLRKDPLITVNQPRQPVQTGLGSNGF